MENKDEITRFLREYDSEDTGSQHRLYNMVYAHLCGLAERQLARERVGHTFTARDLVNEGFFRLPNIDEIDWTSRSHFYKVSVRAMKRVLIDYSRKRNRLKRNEGDVPKASVSQAERVAVSGPELEEFITLYDGLQAFSARHPEGRKKEIVDYFYFQGLEHKEIAEIFNVSTKTIQRDLREVEAWLRRYFGLQKTETS